MAALKTVEKSLFTKTRHELADLLKAVERGTAEAVELLVNTMNATETPEVPLKMRIDCAKTLLDLQVRVAESISKDSLTRTIAEIKVKGLSTPLGVEGEPKRLPPTTDFLTIQQI